MEMLTFEKYLRFNFKSTQENINFTAHWLEHNRISENNDFISRVFENSMKSAHEKVWLNHDGCIGKVNLIDQIIFNKL